LLYYFPDETGPLIAERLRSLDVGAASGVGFPYEVKNRVLTRDFIGAVMWSHAPQVQQALAEVAKRTNDPDIRKLFTARGK
jgi:hypothetical protein